MAENEESISPECTEMCPIAEREKRQQQNLVHILEKDSVSTCRRKLLANPKKMIKTYCRPAAGQNLCKPELLRPPHVLMNTVDYILKEVLLDQRVNKSITYDFINDRFRSIKQDGVIQRISVEDWFQILPSIVRFYAFSAYWFCEEPLGSFDPKLNRNQLLDCLLLLIKNFEQNPSQKCTEMYAEMEALYLIVDCTPETINRAVMLNLPDIFFQNTVKLMLKWFTGNYYAVLQKLAELPLLPACLFCALYLTTLRKNAFRIMSYAYCCKNNRYPSKKLAFDLWCNSVDEINSELTFYGVAEFVQIDEIQFKRVPLLQNYAPSKRSKILDDKLSRIPLQDLLMKKWSE